MASNETIEKDWAWLRWMAMVAIIGGVVLRWIQLGRNSLWFDEGYTAWVVSLPVREMIRALGNDTSPPLYYLVLRVWTFVFGRGEWGLRSLSAVLATGGVLVFYPLALRILRDRFAAMVAMGLFAVSVMEVAYGHEARLYAMVALLAEVNLLLVVCAVERMRRWDYGLMILAWAASLYTSNIMIVYLAGLAIAWLILPGARGIWGRIFDVVLVSWGAVVLYLPWAPTMLAQARALGGNFWVNRPGFETLVRTVAMLGGITDRGVGGWEFERIAWAFAGLVVIVGFGLWAGGWRRGLGLAVFGLGPVAGMFIYSQHHQPIFLDRAFIATTVVMPILIALPMTWRFAGSRWIGGSVGLVVLVAGVLSLRGNYRGEHPEDWRSVCQFVQESRARGRVVVFVANEGELLYDYYARGSDYSALAELVGVPTGFFQINPPRAMARVRSEGDVEFLRSLATERGVDEVVLVESHVGWADDSRRTFRLLNQLMRRGGEAEFDGIVVHRFLPVR